MPRIRGMWTLWLVTMQTVIAGNPGTNYAAPMATFESKQQCDAAIDAAWSDFHQHYGDPVQQPGMFICVPGKKP